MIYILTGAIRSGKTTALKTWTQDRTDVDGFLCPDGKNGKRYFLNVKTKEKFELEVDATNEPTVDIGKFKFLKSGFDGANAYLVSDELSSEYIILDEVGRLELKGEGLHDAAQVLIPKFMHNENQHVILVVRNYLFNEVINHYQIQAHRLLHKTTLKINL